MHTTTRDLATRVTPLDVPMPQTGNESSEAHGARLFMFVLTTGITATLSDSELQRADAASYTAIASPDLSSAALDHYASARRQIARAIAWRAEQDRAERAARDLADDQPDTGDPVDALADDPVIVTLTRLATLLRDDPGDGGAKVGRAPVRPVAPPSGGRALPSPVSAPALPARRPSPAQPQPPEVLF